MGHRSSRANEIRAIFPLLFLFRCVGSVNFITYLAVHPGQRYEKVTLESKKPDLQTCSIYCAKQKPNPCHAFNYRPTDGSCQLVPHGNGYSVEGMGYQSFVTSEKHTYPDCLLTEKGKEYMGRVNVTKSGRACLPWRIYRYSKPDDSSPDKPYKPPKMNKTFEDSFLNRNSLPHHNYCRNPYGKERPWCFVSDPTVQWEFCYVPLCTKSVPPECKLTELGGEYSGRKNVTITGRPCLPWSSFQEEVDLSSLPDSDDADTDHNFCRNPRLHKEVWVRIGPWCYINDTSPVAWEYCDVSFCERRVEIGVEGLVYPECRLTEKGIEYVGSKNETDNGKSCQRWDVESRRLRDLTYPYSLSFYNFTSSISPENHCRNTGQLDRPWCLVSDLNTVWEYCDIPVCDRPKQPECKLSPSGMEYVGKLNATISGYPCKPWLEVCAKSPYVCQLPGSKISDELDGNHRFCRNNNPAYHGPWCFTVSGSESEWEYCDVPFCQPVDGKQCDIRVGGRCVSPIECQDKKGTKYIGTKNVTKKGYRCQPWLSNYPNNQLSIIDYDVSHYSNNERWGSDPFSDASKFPDDLHSEHNYCRNPNGDGGVWCYIATAKGRDYCDVPNCP